MTIVTWSVLLLSVSSVIGIIAAVQLWRRGEDGMRIRFWMMLDFLLAYQVSGFAHVLRLSRSRGYYDALAGNPSGSTSGLMTASVMTLVGTLTLWVGLAHHHKSSGNLPREGGPDSSWTRDHKRGAIIVGLILMAASGFALMKVIAVAQQMASSRIIAVDGGNARYVFLSDWLPVAVAILTLGLWRRDENSDVHNALLLGGAVAVIGGSQAWSGGRSAVLFSCFPLLVMLLPRLHSGTRWTIGSIGLIAITAYVWIQTALRAQSIHSSSGTDIWGLLDWQWGRFSMAAWAQNWVDHFGIVHGGTYLSGLVVVPISIAHFAGITIPDPWTPVVGLTGQYFLGSADQIYIVPGSMAEFFVNFGFLGPAVGYFLMGRLAAWLGDLFLRVRGEVLLLLVASIGSDVLGQMVFQFESFFQSVVMSALPLWALVMLEWRDAKLAKGARRRARRKG